LTNFRQHTDKRGRAGIVLETLTSPSQHLTHPGKFGFEAVSFRAEAVDFVFDFGPSSTSRYDDMDITPLPA